MRSIFLIVTILTTALTQDSDECKFSEAAQHCYSSVGQALIFHVPNTAINFRLKKDDGYLILNVKNNKITIAHKELASHVELLPNGRLSLGKAMKEHSGDYMLEVYTPNGEKKGILNSHLEIQAPVSKTAVSQKCLSSQKTNVSCSSEGDGLEFNLTLNGLLLMQTKDNSSENMPSLAGIEAKNNLSGLAVSISLQGQLTGILTCNVWNEVSSEEAFIHLDICKGSYSFAVVAVRVTFVAFLLLILPTWALINSCHRKWTPEAVNEDVTKNKGETVRRYNKTQSLNKWEQV